MLQGDDLPFPDGGLDGEDSDEARERLDIRIWAYGLLSLHRRVGI